MNKTTTTKQKSNYYSYKEVMDSVLAAFDDIWEVRNNGWIAIDEGPEQGYEGEWYENWYKYDHENDSTDIRSVFLKLNTNDGDDVSEIYDILHEEFTYIDEMYEEMVTKNNMDKEVAYKVLKNVIWKMEVTNTFYNYFNVYDDENYCIKKDTTHDFWSEF